VAAFEPSAIAADQEGGEDSNKSNYCMSPSQIFD
jgi:hypothetical protein